MFDSPRARYADRAWSDLLARHHALVRRQIAHFRGREIPTAGDGFLALFDGPARAVRCGLAIRDAVRTLGLEVRAGLHTGECERMGDNVGGIAVHIGARIVAEAQPGEVLASSTVRDQGRRARVAIVRGRLRLCPSCARAPFHQSAASRPARIMELLERPTERVMTPSPDPAPKVQGRAPRRLYLRFPYEPAPALRFSVTVR